MASFIDSLFGQGRNKQGSAYDRGFNHAQDDMDGEFGESFDDTNNFFGQQSHKYRDDYYAGYEDGFESPEDDG